MSGGNQLSYDQIEKMLVPELRAALKERGIKATGNKAVLRTRLKNPSATDYTRQQQQNVVESEDIEVPDDVLLYDIYHLDEMVRTQSCIRWKVEYLSKKIIHVYRTPSSEHTRKLNEKAATSMTTGCPL